MESDTISESSASIQESPESRRPQMPAYWVFLPGLAASAYVLWMVNPRSNDRLIFQLALLLSVPALAGPLFRALRQRVLASVCALLVVSSYWAGPFFLLFMFSMFAMLSFLFVPPLVFAVAATISLARRLGGTWAIATVGIGLLCGLMIAATVLASKKADLTWPRALDPAVLVPDVLAIDKCSQEFAASHPEAGYPESLAQLGPHGTGCLSSPLLQGQIKGFTINYEPGARDSDGRIVGYEVKARETSPKGADVSSMFSDDSGRIYYRFDGPHGMGSTITDFPGKEAFSLSLDCLWAASLNSTFELLDEHGHRVVTDRDEYMRDCLRGHPFSEKRKFSSGGYNFEYGFISENDGTINGFTVAVRPQQYGIAGIRSYLAIATVDRRTSRHSLNIHATPQDRSATVADPMAQPGEIKPPGYLSSEKSSN